MTNFLEEALRYTTLGWNVFPLAAGQKIPCTAHGVKDATTDEAQIRAWWEKWPDANIAVACGVGSGVYVVDVDVEASTGIDGRESLKEFPSLPETIRQDTPRGGFHAFFKTGNAPANRNNFRPGVDIRGDGYYVVLAPSVHPNGGRYCWTPGHAPWEIEPVEYPEFMRPVTRAPWAAPVKEVVTFKGVPLVHDPDLSGDDTLRRASLYLGTIDPAIQGQGGHDKLLWAAVAMVHGFLLSDSQAHDLLVREYNPCCIPPWDLSDKAEEKDFRRKVTEARKLNPQNSPGWLLDDPAYAPVSNVHIDIKGLLKGSGVIPSNTPEKVLGDTLRSKSISEKDTPQDADELNFLVQPTGLFGEICAWINATSIKEQPLLSLACVLTFLGALFGRKIRDTLGGRTNLYCMGVAPSSAGKAHAMNQIRRLAEKAGCVELLGGDGVSSDTAIEDRIARVPATLFLWDEIGHLLAHIKSGISKHHSQVVSLLMKLYSSSGNIYLGREYADSEKQRVISEPCCCIYGTSTPERFAGGVSIGELQDGWLSRCLVFCTASEPPKTRGKFNEFIDPEIVRKVAAWYARGAAVTDGHTVSQLVTTHYTAAPPEKMVISSDRAAENLFVSLDNESIKYGKEDPQMACLWAKAEENARRIALIVAAGENFDEPAITASSAEYSCRLIRFLLHEFCRTIAPEIVSSRLEQNKRDLLAIIRRGGKDGYTKRRITRASQWSDKRGRDNMLADLLEAGEIAVQAEGKTTRYWIAEHYVVPGEK